MTNILVLIPTRSEVSEVTMKSIRDQTVGNLSILVITKKMSLNIPVGIRVARTINSFADDDFSSWWIMLKNNDYILRTDDDAYLPPNFLEENLKLNADVVGSSGYGQLIKTKPFMFCLNGRFPEVIAEDSYIFYYFKYLGLKACGYKVRPEKLKRKKHNLQYWLNVGGERYRIGYLPHMVILSFRDSISGFNVGFNAFYIFLGYILSSIKRLKKYPFNKMVSKLQLFRLVKQ